MKGNFYIEELSLVAVLAGAAVIWHTENPEKVAPCQSRPVLQRQVSLMKKTYIKSKIWTLDRLHDMGFFENFGLLTVVAVVLELYLISQSQTYYSSMIWLCLVGYVGANHFLYALYNWSGTCGAFSEEDTKMLKTLAGVGGMLKSEQQINSWTCFLWNFSEHRLADVWVHAGMIARMPYRADHWVALIVHLLKYADIGLPAFLTFDIRLGPGALRVDDAIDCFAHTLSSILFLGPSIFGSAVALAEAQRWILRATCYNHNKAPPPATHHHNKLSVSPRLRRRSSIALQRSQTTRY